MLGDYETTREERMQTPQEQQQKKKSETRGGTMRSQKNKNEEVTSEDDEIRKLIERRGIAKGERQQLKEVSMKNQTLHQKQKKDQKDRNRYSGFWWNSEA